MKIFMGLVTDEDFVGPTIELELVAVEKLSKNWHLEPKHVEFPLFKKVASYFREDIKLLYIL
jgi:hypothetical protein